MWMFSAYNAGKSHVAGEKQTDTIETFSGRC